VCIEAGNHFTGYYEAADYADMPVEPLPQREVMRSGVRNQILYAIR
jgi:hypothetical protein